MSPQELKRFAATCADFGNRAADESGFVALHRLAGLLRSEIEFRPLLVEAVIAAPAGPGAWKVFVDSETHPQGAAAFTVESSDKPLTSRLRNTVAHELLHTLSFRLEEFGFQLELTAKETRAQAVKRLEADTENFSPFLLLPQNFLEAAIAGDALSLSILLDWRRRWSVSREILIARFGLIKALPEFPLRYHAHLSNVALCLGEWVNGDSAVLLEWPIYFNFNEGIVPEFILQLRAKGKPQLRELFPDPDFYLSGGANAVTQSVVAAGTSSNPRSEKLTISVSVETVSRKKGEVFLVAFKTVL